jgi:hypothetical protein
MAQDRGEGGSSGWGLTQDVRTEPIRGWSWPPFRKLEPSSLKHQGVPLREGSDTGQLGLTAFHMPPGAEPTLAFVHV